MKIGPLTAVAVLAIGAYAYGKADDRATFAAMYQKAQQAFNAKNSAAVAAGTTADFTETSMGRKMNKAESMAGLKQFMSMFKTINCHFTMTKCSVKGNMAMTEDDVHITGTSMMGGKKPHKLDMSRHEAMTWTKVGGKWMLKAIVASKEKAMMDGKPMPMGPAKG